MVRQATSGGTIRLRGVDPSVPPVGRNRSAHRTSRVPLRFLFTTLGHIESDFYARVGAELERQGHEVGHLTYSRRAARVIRASGGTAWCLPDLMRALPAPATDAAASACRTYDLGSLREVDRTDFVCDGRSDSWRDARTLRHLEAIERLFDEWRPDAVVPEIGNETIRTAAHLIGVRRGVPVLLLLYTIFDAPLRLEIDDLRTPIVQPENLRALSTAERAEVDEFARRFIAHDRPIRAYRDLAMTSKRGGLVFRHAFVKAVWDRDNPYLRPLNKLTGHLTQRARSRLARQLYRQPPADRPYLYFPLHIVDDYKLKRLVPHRADQLDIVRRVAAALPEGHALVVKEHPDSIGRNSMSDLRALCDTPNVVLTDPHTSSHQLISASRGVVVISSTVGLEALLHDKPVLTLGRPFYAGAGVTRDLDTLDLDGELDRLVETEVDDERAREFLHAAMRRCRPGAPVLVDRSDENARVIAGSIADAAAAETQSRRRSASVQSSDVSMLSDAAESTR